MKRLSALALLPAALGALALPAGASAATTGCHLMGARPAADHAIGTTGLVARDPYGGLLSRNRLFFDFSLRGPKAALAGVAKVSWALDGTVVREDPSAPFEWKGPSGSDRRIPAGDHTITVTVTPASGAPTTTSFPLTATDCQVVSFTGEVPKARGAATLAWQSALESGDGEPLTTVTAQATKNVVARLPAALRGRPIGRLHISTTGNARTGKTYTLKGAATALSRDELRVRFAPGAKGFLQVSGLPAGTQVVQVTLNPGVLQLGSPRSSYRIGGGFRAASGTAAAEFGGSYA
jgi:hypothetical protein